VADVSAGAARRQPVRASVPPCGTLPGPIDKYALGDWCDTMEGNSDRCWLLSNPRAYV